MGGAFQEVDMRLICSLLGFRLRMGFCSWATTAHTNPDQDFHPLFTRRVRFRSLADSRHGKSGLAREWGVRWQPGAVREQARSYGWRIMTMPQRNYRQNP